MYLARPHVRNTTVTIYVNRWSKIIETDGQTPSTTMINYRQTPWSTIIKNHGQQSSTTMIKHRKKPWSTIVKNHGNKRLRHA
jgi:hypothetical protein